jgi:hypothetical protein
LASLDDILTTQKNGVQGINSVADTQLLLAGKQNYKEISSATVVKGSAGWVARVCVLQTGSDVGNIYDATLTSGAVTGFRVGVITNTIGYQDVMMPFSTGIVVTPSNGMIVTVSYS